MSVSFRDRLPPGLITLVVAYILLTGALAFIRYFDLGDFFFPRPVLHHLIIGALVVGPIYLIVYSISYFHPEWHDWSKDNNFSGGD